MTPRQRTHKRRALRRTCGYAQVLYKRAMTHACRLAELRPGQSVFVAVRNGPWGSGKVFVRAIFPRFGGRLDKGQRISRESGLVP